MTEDEALEDTEVGTISVQGGTAPYSYELTGTDANDFKIEGTTIKLANTLIENEYVASVKVTDAKGKEKTSDNFTVTVIEE